MNSMTPNPKKVMQILFIACFAFAGLTACGEKDSGSEAQAIENNRENDIRDNVDANGKDTKESKDSKSDTTATIDVDTSDTAPPSDDKAPSSYEPAPDYNETKSGPKVALACKDPVGDFCTEFYEDTPNIQMLKDNCAKKLSKCPVHHVTCHFEQFKYTVYFGAAATDSIGNDQCVALGGKVIH